MQAAYRWVVLFVLLFASAGGPSSGQTAGSGAAPQVDSRITSLRALAKLYGYVRYFHPSDEAAGIDWQAFAVHGAGRVKGVQNPRALRDALDELFAPIAPTAQILLVDDEARDRAALAPGDTSELVVVAWQHFGHGVDSAHLRAGSASVYWNARTNRARPESASGRFAEHPQPGEVTATDLGGGVRCIVPLALWSDGDHTLGQSRAALEPLVEELGRVDTTDATSEDVRLGATVVAWNVFQHFYPYFDVVDTDWDAALTEGLTRARAAHDAGELQDALKLLVVGLRDGHGNVYSVEQRTARGFPPWRLAFVEGKILVTASAGRALKRGDQLLRVDGQDALALYEQMVSRRSGSERWKRAIALENLGYGPDGSFARVEVERNGEVLTVRVPRGSGERLKEYDRPDVQELDSGIWYVSLDRASMDEIRPHLDQIAAAPGVIFDLRSYPNKNHDVIAHLLPRADDDRWMFIAKTIYPDRERIVGWKELGWNVKPAEPHIGGKVVFITSGRAISYAESWMGYVEAYQLGEIVGQATAGANGNVVPFEVPGGFKISWTGMKVLKHDGSQQHLIGILPTVPVERTVRGIREGRDEYLERALELFERR